MPLKPNKIQAGQEALLPGGLPVAKLEEINLVNPVTVNLWAKEIAVQVKTNPFAIADSTNPSDELLNRAKYLLIVAEDENATFARDYLSELIHRRAHATILRGDDEKKLDFEKDVLGNKALHTTYLRRGKEVNNALHLASAQENLSYAEYNRAIAFKKELAEHIQVFREGAKNNFRNSFEFLKFWEFLNKKFPDLSTEEIKREVKKYRAEFEDDVRPNVATLLMAQAAHDKISLQLAYNLENEDHEDSLRILEEFKNGCDCFANLFLESDEIGKIHLPSEARISLEDVNKHTHSTASFILHDLIPNTTLRRALENDLNQMESFGNQKIKRNKNHDPVVQEQGEAAITLAQKLRELSNKYFIYQVKSDELKKEFKENCSAEIKKANEILGKEMPMKWKDLVKSAMFIVATIATGGLALMAKAAYMKFTTGKVGSLFHKKENNLAGKRKLADIESKLSAQVLKEKQPEDIEMSESSTAAKKFRPS
jgi:hypothetical protein